MARAKLRTRRGGKEVKCGKCGKVIQPGEKYWTWKFRFGGKHARCSEHPPKASDLTRSKLSGVYSAVEGVEEDIKHLQAGGLGVEELADSLDSAADSIEEVASEYEDSRSNMPEGLQEGPTGQDMEEKAESLNEFAERLRDAANEIREMTGEGDIVKEAAAKAEEAIGENPV